MNSPQPTHDQAIAFRESLVDKHLSRSSINNYSFTIQLYHGMLGAPIKLPYMSRGEKLPYFFGESDIEEIFYNTTNIKYLAMLQVGFYGCLRASEICNLDDEDVDFINKTIRIRGGKNNKDSVQLLNDECISTILEYIKRRPEHKVAGRQPLFYTQKGTRYNRRLIYNIFQRCKVKAGVTKRGGLHVFCGHSSASLLLKNGADLLTTKEILRHKSIQTTEKYLHLSDQTKRAKYDQYLRT